MVRIQKISKPQLQTLIFLGFRDDEDLVKKYHIINKDMESCVMNTIARINDTARMFELEFYKVICDNKPIGFFVTGDKFLYSFAVNKKWRKKGILVDLWGQIVKVLGGSFMCMLYKKNERAINFLKKNSMEEIDSDQNTLTLKYVKSCH